MSFRAVLLKEDRQRQAGLELDGIASHGTIWVGIITLEDIIETILGQDIVDETDNVANLRKYARQRWTKSLKKVEEE